VAEGVGVTQSIYRHGQALGLDHAESENGGGKLNIGAVELPVAVTRAVGAASPGP
jgi:hypothetical protein